MAHENLELARSIFAAWEQGDFFSWGSWAHPDIEFVLADLPGARVMTGRDGMSEGWREFLGAWQDFRTTADELRELDDERVLVLSTFSGQGAHSGLEVGEVHVHGVLVFHFRDGMVRRIVAFFNRERGLAELGLA